MSRGLQITVAVCVTAVILAGMGLLFVDCQNTDERIQQCISGGREPDACRRAFAPRSSR